MLTFFDILDFWWSHWTIWNVLMMRNFDFQSWPKKSKFDVVWTVDFLSDDSKFPLSLNHGVGDVLSQEIRSRWCIRAPEIIPQAIRSCLEQKVNSTLSSVKTLIWSIQSLELDEMNLRTKCWLLMKIDHLRWMENQTLIGQYLHWWVSLDSKPCLAQVAHTQAM